MIQARQGDVYLHQVTEKPSAKATPETHLTLALGEATGHHHTVTAEATDTETFPPAMLFTEPDGTRMLLVERPCSLVHQEHGPIALTPGSYKITIQREYAPEGIRQVLD